MVDLRLLLNPPLSTKFELLRRRCSRQERRHFGEITTGCGFVASGCGGSARGRELDVDGLIGGGEELPHLTKRNLAALLCASIVLVAAVIVIVGCTTGFFSKRTKEKDELVPPNPVRQLPPSASKLHTFRRAAVCADGPPCAEVGRNILAKNGSAVDATIAAMFCNGIVTMQSMGLGGGFLMTIYKRDEQKAYSLNAREKAPLAANDKLYEKDAKLSQSGPLAIAVPGELKGYWEAHRKFGKLPWEELVNPTIEICENGFNMSDHQYNAIFKNRRIQNDPTFKKWFRDKSGEFKKMGSKIVPKKLCETLRIIARGGVDELYNGNLTKGFLEDIREVGGIITERDLLEYNIEWQDPISVKFSNQDNLFTAPPPGSGALLGFMMNILDGYGFNPKSIDGIDNTVLTYHRIIEAFKYAYAKRTELGDLNFINITNLLQNLTSKEYANVIRMKIKDNSTSEDPRDYGAIYFGTEDHGTAHISVLAENGDAVSVTSSVNIYFGAGIISKSTGILLGSSIDDFSFPSHLNYFGLPGSPNNKLEPRKRPLSSMTPSIISDKNGEVRMVIGASGGTKITTTVAQIIMRVLWFGQNIKEAVDAPRIHHQLFPMMIEYEYGTLQQIVDGLKSLGHKVSRNAGSIACALLKEADKIIGNADYRKGGEVYGIM